VTPAKRLAVRGVVAAVALGVASAAYQQISDARDRRRFPPPGRLVDIGGRRLHLLEAGEGAPTVVIVPAVGGGVLEWLPIVRQVADTARVCVYDRAGIGWSDPPRRGRRTVNGMTEDLHNLLFAAGIKHPYVLVGHSLGGVIARRFITCYPGMACGLLLVDSSHEDQVRRFGRVSWRLGPLRYYGWAVRRQARILGARRLAASLGLWRGLDASVAREFPPDFADAGRAQMLSTRRRRIGVREVIILPRSQGSPQDLGSLPLTVLTAAEGGPDPRVRPAWIKMQTELVALSTDSRHEYANEAGHYIHLDEPSLVVEAVRELLARCRVRIGT
jgi:pimeloyl-ACP methyl ester carboxylesterase